MALSTASRQQILTNLGWRTNSSARYVAAVRDFQRGWNLGPALVVDGRPGPKTDGALAISERQRRAGRPTASANFSFIDFRCKCGGRYSGCARIWTARRLFQAMESYRATAGPTYIVSGCRCRDHNRAVGGASSSQHMAGLAADVAGVATTARVKGIRVFTGIGYKGVTGKVQHVDVRPGPSTTRPTMWRYS